MKLAATAQQQPQHANSGYGMTGAKEMQVRLVARGCETVLGDAASDSELFLTSDFLTRCTINPQQRT